MERVLHSVWIFPTPLEPVWAALADIQAWSRWWPSVGPVETLEAGDAYGLGAVYRLSGGLEFRVCEVQAPQVLEAHTETVLARWLVYCEEGYTSVHLSLWGCTKAETPFKEAMAAGAWGLAQHLGTALTEAGSWSALSDDPWFS
ncbi:MAG: SRPBCC family protein [Thermaceae bacterium]|nr:SRPBCC family protein [Thermaceae bacterium]